MIKFNGLSRTVDIEVHVIHISHVIITHVGIIIFPHTDKTQGPTHMVEGDHHLRKIPKPQSTSPVGVVAVVLNVQFQF